MSDGLVGNADPGISEDVQSITDVQADTGIEPVNDADTQEPDSSEQMTEKERGLLRELQKERDENKRLKDYQQFLKDASRYEAPAQQSQSEEFDLPPDSIPYVSDVQKLAQLEARRIIAEERKRETEERVVAELTSLSAKNRESDPNFDKRMEYAMEILNSDEVYKRTLSREQTAEGVLKRLEQFATFHPLFDSVKPKPASQPKVDDALKRIQENAKIPPSLSGVQGAGATQKSIQDMNDSEYMDFFKNVTSKL